MKNDKYILSGIVLPFNVRSSVGGRIYTRESISRKVFDEFKSKVNEGKAVGVLEQRASLVDQFTPLEQISHKVIHAEMGEDGIYVEIEVLDTPKGELVKEMLNAGVALWGASRGLGVVNPENNLCCLDNLLAIDLTGCPTFNPDDIKPLSVNGLKYEQFIASRLKDKEKPGIVEQEQEQDDPTYFTPKQKEEISKMIDRKIENFAKEVQKWVTEEFAPTIQEWLTEQFVHTLKIEVNKDKLEDE